MPAESPIQAAKIITFWAAVPHFTTFSLQHNEDVAHLTAHNERLFLFVWLSFCAGQMLSIGPEQAILSLISAMCFEAFYPSSQGIKIQLNKISICGLQTFIRKIYLPKIFFRGYTPLFFLP